MPFKLSFLLAHTVLPGYPREIRDFSLKHMKDSGVNVITQARATKITPEAISIHDKTSNTTKDFPYGLVVWATGVTPTPLIKKLMSQLPDQMSYRSLKTDSRCQVLGAPDLYAIGDCADIDLYAEYKYKLGTLFRDIHQRFPAGTDKDRTLSLNGHEELVERLKEISEQFVSAPIAKIYKDVRQDLLEKKRTAAKMGISYDTLMEVLEKHLERQKILPPTAQVAHQQGEYLAKLLNHPKVVDPKTNNWTFDHNPLFEFSNKGQLVYVGGHMAALSVPVATKNEIHVSWNGTMTNYLWHAAYFGMLESASARCELVFDWVKSRIFGRSTALDAICSSDSHLDTLGRRGETAKKRETTPKKWWWF